MGRTALVTRIFSASKKIDDEHLRAICLYMEGCIERNESHEIVTGKNVLPFPHRDEEFWGEESSGGG